MLNWCGTIHGYTIFYGTPIHKLLILRNPDEIYIMKEVTNFKSPVIHKLFQLGITDSVQPVDLIVGCLNYYRFKFRFERYPDESINSDADSDAVDTNNNNTDGDRDKNDNDDGKGNENENGETKIGKKKETEKKWK
ncbi:unnamed protein product [Ambrosiozyma monospora]|uniref:Unnamed protein product n=1 Tax=Ambrosiozyma monospora TaxID=43982 RepID=A0ACB5SYM9_AMBMO|nr:unnamed protein product [Ambrosiozyma monospora]